MNSGFRPDAEKPSGNDYSSAAAPLMPSPECARNPGTPADYLRFLTQFPNLHTDLALNPALPPDLEQWIKGHPDPAVQANLRARDENLAAPASEEPSPANSASASPETVHTGETDDNFDATTLAGSVPPVTKPLPTVSGMPGVPPQDNATPPSGISPAVTGNLSPQAATQSFPQLSGYPQGMPPAAPYTPNPNFAPGYPPPASPGYPPVPGQYPRPRRKRRWLVPLIAVIAVLAVIGGGIGAYFAFAGFKHVGYDSPEELADALKASLDNSDLIGIAQMSAPSEDVFVEDALQLNKDLQKYISTADSKSQGGSGNLEDKVSDLTSVMQNLDIDTSGLSSKVDNLSDDISRINYSGRIDVKIKDRDKLKASLDKLVFNNQDAPKKETDLNDLLEAFDDLEKDGIEYKTRSPLQIMAVREDAQWYYSILTSYADYIAVGPGGAHSDRVNYKANWADPGETPSNAEQFRKDLAGAMDSVSNLGDLLSEDCMRFLDLPERRLLMIYAFAGESSVEINLKTRLSEIKKTFYGTSIALEDLNFYIYDEIFKVSGGKITYMDSASSVVRDISRTLKNGKFELVAKQRSNGLKLSLAGSVANLFSNLDYDFGLEYAKEGSQYDALEETIDEDRPYLRPYRKVVLAIYGLLRKVDLATEREDYSDDSDSDYDSDYDYDEYDS